MCIMRCGSRSLKPAVSGDTVYVDAIRGPTGEITRIDSTTNCETVNEVLIN